MITYTYKCKECGHLFETQQRISDSALTDCPECKQPSLQRVITTAGGFRIGGRGVSKPTSRMEM